MTTWRALGLALAVTVISIILLTIVNGTPTEEEVWRGGTIMFSVAFVLLKYGKS